MNKIEPPKDYVLDIYLFVYGSLKRNHYNNKFLDDSEFIVKGRTSELFSLRDLGSFPYVDMSESVSFIYGEVWKVPGYSLKEIDKLQGYPVFYNRKVISICTDKKDIDSWIYYINKPDEYKDTTIIMSGNWELDKVYF